MSKTIKDMTEALFASNEQLFDRYINVRLCRDKPRELTGVFTSKRTSLTDVFKPLLRASDLDFQIVCPKTGLKPNITVSGEWNLKNTVNNISLTIYNMDANIDTMCYNFAEVDVGYYNSGIHVTFVGEIINCYMAKPNPNGELVVNVACAPVVGLYEQGAFEVMFTKDIVLTPELITTCAQTLASKHPKYGDDFSPKDLVTSIPKEWLTQAFAVGKGTRHFRSAMDCITWLNSLFATFTYDTHYDMGVGGAPSSAQEVSGRLPPLRLGFDTTGHLFCLCTSNETNLRAVQSLPAIGSAFLTSPDSATVTAPFNPCVMPGSLVSIDTAYFKTRVNMDAIRIAYKSMSDLWVVLRTQFTFSTHTVNTMTIMLNNAKNKPKGKDG
jgi:hypothetical protein